MSTKTKSDQLEWRRSKVVELRSRGLSYQEISRELQVSKASITSDVQYLREQAKESIKEYVRAFTRTIPSMSLRIRYHTQTCI